MYIKYITPQRIADTNFTDYQSNGGEYRPTWLIRISDWQKVPGAKATHGYHTLSYCWEQSGDMFQKANGEFGLNDAGHHQIIKQRNGQSITEDVTYDILIQQLCNDFGIEYLWYDKICIDQTNKEEKHREIKQMHLIYSNACYTVALVPEIFIDDPELFERRNWIATKTDATREALKQMEKSLWWKRSWTLEEMMMSTRMLVVGQNTHFWCLARDKQEANKVKEEDFMSQEYLGFKDRKAKHAANEVLHLAHFRTSSKAHDKIFALANIFNGIISIDINYDTNVSATMNTFYQQLVRHDLSIMCFGSILSNFGQPRYNSTMFSHNLPSWTGVFGFHASRIIDEIILNKNSNYDVDTDMCLHIKCRGYPVRPTKYPDDDLLSNDDRCRQARDKCFKLVESMDAFQDETSALDWSQWCMYVGANCKPTHYWKPNQLLFCSPIVPFSLTDEVDDECIILEILYHIASPMSLETDDEGIIISGYLHFYYLPVIKKSIDDSVFKAIGIVLLKHFLPNQSYEPPAKFLDKVFSNLPCTFNEFDIK